MAIYNVESPSGVKFNVEGDSPPNEQELEDIFKSISSNVQTSTVQRDLSLQRPEGEGVFPLSTFTPLQRNVVSGLLTPAFGSTLSDFITSRISGRPVTQVEAASEAGLEEIVRLPGQTAQVMADFLPNTPGLGALPSAIQAAEFIGAIPKGTLESSLQKLVNPLMQAPETIENLLGVEQGSERAKFREPLGAAVGEIGAQFFPPVAAIPRGAALTGEAIEQTVRALTPSIPPSKVLARGFRVPTIEKATGLLRGVEEEKLGEILSSAPPRIIESYGKLPKGGKQGIEAAIKAEKIAFDEAKDFLKQAEEGGYAMKGDSMLESGREAVLRNFESLSDDAQAVDNLLSPFSDLRGQISPLKGQRRLRELNLKYESLVDKRSPEAFAYRAIRDNLSNQLDDIVKLSSGKNVQPYRDWGNIREFRTGIENRLEEARQAAGREAVPTSSEPLVGAGTTVRGQVLGALARRVGRLARPLIKQGKEFIDEASDAIFKDSPKKVVRDDLPEETISTLRQRYLKAPPVLGSSATTPPSISPADLEAQIKSLISTYPLSLRRDPGLARAAALGELQQSIP